MAKYRLTERDVRDLRETHAIVRGGQGSRLPVPQRRRNRSGAPSPHQTLTGTLTTATVANQVWATVTPEPGYQSFGPTVRVQLADNASARPAGDKVIAHRFKDVQSLANPPAVAVDVPWEETPAGEGGDSVDHPLINIFNDSGGLLPAGSIQRIATPVGGSPVRRLHNFTLVAPTRGFAYAVTITAAADGELALAACVGVVQVVLNYTDEDKEHQWADITTADNAKMVSGETGSARIVWRAKATQTGAATTGDQAALVLLRGDGAGGDSQARGAFGVVTQLVPTRSQTGDLSTWDLAIGSSGTGKVVQLVDAESGGMELPPLEAGESAADAQTRLEITVDPVSPVELEVGTIVLLSSNGTIRPDSDWNGGASDPDRAPVRAWHLTGLEEFKQHKNKAGSKTYTATEYQILDHEDHAGTDPDTEQFRWSGDTSSCPDP